MPRILLVSALFGALAAAGAAAQENGAHPGKAPYDKWCAACHGVDGAGEGAAAAYMLPRPRDFTQANYQIRTTGSGDLPTDADIQHVIDVGMPGTAMPGWERKLSERERTDLVSYLKTFSRFFDPDDPPEPIAVGRAPSMGEEELARGQALYASLECGKCHGDAGRGDGPSAPTMDDDNGFPIRPADLSENWNFNGGGSVEAIYTRLMTGLNGTPMPSLQDVVVAGQASEEDIWALAHYVRSLSPEQTPRASEVVRAVRIEGALPTSPDDAAWDEHAPAWIPLVGQIIVRPRYFAPTVDGVWVQALHNGEEVALRLVWHDPSRSPSAEWSAWRSLVAQTLEPREDSAAASQVGADRFTVQIPTEPPDGMEVPYFLGGSERRPVNLWEWRSDQQGITERLARGIHASEVLPQAAQSVSGQASFDRGQWRLVLRRPIAAADTTSQLTLPTGSPIPIAFFAADGDNGEVGGPGSISSWYYLWLDEPASSRIYTVPISAMVLTALLGVVVVARAQRRERTGAGSDTQ